MMIMRWCNLQTNEYNLQAKTYPTICIHHVKHEVNTELGIILGMGLVNERMRYIVTTLVIGWAHAQKVPCDTRINMIICAC